MTTSPDPLPHPFADLVGFVVEVTGLGTADARLDVGEQHHNPNGTPHGAVLFALVDTSMGGAAMSVLAPGQFCASIEVQLRFLRPAFGHHLRASTEVVRAGKRVIQLASAIYADDEPDPVATATGSFAVLGVPAT